MAADPQIRRVQQQKPFASLAEAPAMLYRLGLALDALDLGVGHRVLDFGAGSCWLSLALNRLGCRTISVDISRTALALGSEAFERDPCTRWDLSPEFLPYDGRRLPLADGSIDRAICFDAFHHVPNPTELLQEFFRVLRTGGRLVMAEPGVGHAHSDAAVFEATHYGVLESDVLIDDLVAEARRAGFRDLEMKPYPDVDSVTLSAEAHLDLLAGDHSLFPLDHAVAAMREIHVVALTKGAAYRDSRNPGKLAAHIDTLGRKRLRGEAGKELTFQVRVANLGDTLWLAAEDSAAGGYVNLGGHLLDRKSGHAIRVGFFAQRLPSDVPPGECVDISATFGLPESEGAFTLRLDMVDAKVAWFSQSGSPTADLELDVSWSDSRDPHRFEARIERLPSRVSVEAVRHAIGGAAFPLHLRIENTGDTTWLDGPADRRGSVTVGVQRLDPDGGIAERDYFRIPLPRRVAPGESIDVRALVPLKRNAGRRFAVDLVAEQVCWFAQHGSKPLIVGLPDPEL